MLKFKEVKHSKITQKNNLILGVDLGGTNSNFGIFNEKLKLLNSFHFKSQEITNFTEIINQILHYIKKKYNLTIKLACFAAACPIHEKAQYCSLTNTKWDVDLKKIKKKTNLKILALINDFEAIAYGLDVLPKKDLLVIKKGKVTPKSPKIMVGAGTGLGSSILVWDNKTNHYKTLKSEGGHGDFPPQNKKELELAKSIKTNANIEWEDVLSGDGITNIYKYLSKKSPKNKFSKKIKERNFNSMTITQYRKKDKICKETFRWFTKFYGRYAKTFSLGILPKGGIYIGGGIVAKNSDIFKSKVFMKEFLNSKKQKSLLENFKVTVIKNYNISLYGAAQAALLKKRGLL